MKQGRRVERKVQKPKRKMSSEQIEKRRDFRRVIV